MGVAKLTKTHFGGRLEQLLMSVDHTKMYVDRAGRLDEVGARRPSLILESGSAELVITLSSEELRRLEGLLAMLKADVLEREGLNPVQEAAEARP